MHTITFGSVNILTYQFVEDVSIQNIAESIVCQALVYSYHGGMPFSSMVRSSQMLTLLLLFPV